MAFVVAALVSLALIAVNAFFVATEFAAVAARATRVGALAERGNRIAAILHDILSQPATLDRYIAASQIGITVSSLVLGAYAQSTFGAWLAPSLATRFRLEPLTALSTAAAAVLVTLTAVQIVVGEMVPKLVALQYPVRVALITVLPNWWITRAFGWFIDALNGAGAFFLRLLGFEQSSHQHVHSPEEIELILKESREGGLLEPHQHRRLQRALKLSHRTAADLMVPRLRVSALSDDTPIDRAFDYVVASPYTRMPVYRSAIDHVIGLIHTKDLVRSALTAQPHATVASLVRPVVTVAEQTTADQLLQRLRERRAHQAIVRDEEGRFAGFVTLEDVLGELFGPIGDEFKAGNV